MVVRFLVDDREVLETLKALGEQDVMTAWSEAILQLVKRHAASRIGGTFGQEIARSVQVTRRGRTATIAMNTARAYIGEHVHFGGPIRSHNGKRLAIPLPTASTAKYNPKRIFASGLRERLFKITSKKGNELLFRRPGKGQELEPPLFVLKDATRPQRPRPWWPTQAEAEAETVRYFKENF